MDDSVEFPPEAPGVVGKYRIHGKPIGKGAYGKVYVCSKLGSTALYATKMVLPGNPDGSMDDQLRHEFIQREALHLSQLRHKNIVEFEDLQHDQGLVFLFMPLYLEHGDLHKFIHGVDQTVQRHLTEPQTVHTHRQLCAGVRYLHFMQVVHRDLKPKNVLIAAVDAGGNPTVKVSDFGQSIMRGEHFQGTLDYARHVGTFKYMAPEMFKTKGKGCDSAVDNWSLGIVLYEMMTGSCPGDTTHEDNNEIKLCPCKSSQAKLEHDIKNNMPPNLHRVALGHLDLDPSKRNTAEETEELLLQCYPHHFMEGTTTSSSSSSSSSSTVVLDLEQPLVDLEQLPEDSQPLGSDALLREIAHLREQLAQKDEQLAQKDRTLNAYRLALAQRDEFASLAVAEKLQAQEDSQRQQYIASVALAEKLQAQADSEVQQEALQEALAQALQAREDSKQQQEAADRQLALQEQEQVERRAAKRRRVSMSGDCVFSNAFGPLVGEVARQAQNIFGARILG